MGLFKIGFESNFIGVGLVIEFVVVNGVGFDVVENGVGEGFGVVVPNKVGVVLNKFGVVDNCVGVKLGIVVLNGSEAIENEVGVVVILNGSEIGVNGVVALFKKLFVELNIKSKFGYEQFDVDAIVVALAFESETVWCNKLVVFNLISDKSIKSPVELTLSASLIARFSSESVFVSSFFFSANGLLKL